MRTVVFGCLFALCLSSYAADWPVWRGPYADGISRDKSWDPAALENGTSVVWRKNVGAGYSAFTVKDGKAFTMGLVEDRDVVYCLDAETGDKVWEHEYSASGGGHPGPRATPVTDDGMVFAVGRGGEVHCLDFSDGSVVWTEDIKEQYGAELPRWGHSASPAVVGDMLVLNALKHGLALDKKTGKKIWASEADKSGYAVPVIAGEGDGTVAFVFGKDNLWSVEVKTGKPKWSFPWKTSYDVNAADPIVFDEKVFISSGYNTGAALLDISKGKPRVLWQHKQMRNHFGTSVLIGGALYGVDGNAGKGSLVCIDWATGAEKWRADTGFGAMTASSDKLIFLNEAGMLYVVEAKPDNYSEVSKGSTGLSKKCWTMPVLANGLVYCRNHEGNVAVVSMRPEPPGEYAENR